jgi:hypothetical protein
MKTYALAGCAIVGALAIPATASATEVVGSLACVDGHPQATLTDWHNSTPDAHPYTFRVDGVLTDSGRLTIVSNPQTLTSAAVLTGEHDLIVSVGRFTAAAHVVCGAPATVVPQPPTGQPPDVVPLALAGGTTTAVQAGPGTPAKVKKAAKVKAKKAKQRVTCAYLRRVGAGPRTYARYGWTYRCRVSIQQVGPNLPAVTG